MDANREAILKAREKQIDIDLEDELLKIEEEYSERNMLSSGPFSRAKARAAMRAQARKDEVRAQLELGEKTKKNKEGEENARIQLLDPFLGNNKYKVHKRMAKLFVKNLTVKNYLLASCIRPTILGALNNKRRKFNKTDYSSKKKEYDKQIKTRLKLINKFWEPLGFNVKFSDYSSNLTETNS